MSNKEYGRKPQMNFVNRYGTGGDYLSQKEAVTKAEVFSQWSERDSEFEKPYADGIEYSEMQHFHPSNYGLDDMSITRTGPQIKDLCDGAFMDAWASVDGALLKFPTIPCGGGSAILIMQGHDGQGVPWGNRISWVASPVPLVGFLADNIYLAPPCNQVGYGGVTENISGFSPCGQANIIITVVNPNICQAATVTISGNENAAVGICYTASGGAAPYTWSIDKGEIDTQTGCITSTTGVCGMAVVTATDACGNVGTKQVRLPTGVWVLISTFNHGSRCAGNWTCNSYSGDTRLERLVNCTDEAIFPCLATCGVAAMQVDPACTPVCGVFPIVWCPKTTKTYQWQCP